MTWRRRVPETEGTADGRDAAAAPHPREHSLGRPVLRPDPPRPPPPHLPRTLPGRTWGDRDRLVLDRGRLGSAATESPTAAVAATTPRQRGARVRAPHPHGRPQEVHPHRPSLPRLGVGPARPACGPARPTCGPAPAGARPAPPRPRHHREESGARRSRAQLPRAPPGGIRPRTARARTEAQLGVGSRVRVLAKSIPCMVTLSESLNIISSLLYSKV